ncbi:MAG: phosphate ABC transporter permease PstA [Eubacteriales bacterium]
MKKLNPLKALVYAAAAFTLSVVVFIIIYILYKGVPQIIIELQSLFQGGDSLFQWTYNSSNVSLVPAVMNTLIMVGVSLTISAFLGISTAIYLVEYAKTGNKFVEVIRITSETLSGIPSIIYGLFGMIFFVTYVGLGMTLISGILTVSIMILPLIIRSTEEALKAVPLSYREASFGLGAAKLRTIIVIILPSAINGILAGVILAIGRVIGETAALLYTAGTSTSGGVAVDVVNTGGRTLSVHMYMLTSEGLHIDQAYATAAVLLVVVVGLNAMSYALAKKLTKGK